MKKVSGGYSGIPVGKLLCQKKMPQVVLDGVVLAWHELLSADPDTQEDFKRICSDILCANMFKQIFTRVSIANDKFLVLLNELFEAYHPNMFSLKEVEDIKIICTPDNVEQMLSNKAFNPPQVDCQFISQMRETGYLEELASMLSKVQFTNQHIINANFCYLCFPPNQQIFEMEFINSSFIYAQMCDMVFSQTRLCNTELTDCDLTGANFSDCLEIIECRFDASTMAHALFNNKPLVKCSFINTSLKHATLSGAMFESCNIKGADFSHANLDGVTFCGLVFDNAIGGNKHIYATTANFIRYLQTVSSIDDKYIALKLKLMEMIFDNYKDAHLDLNSLICYDDRLFPETLAIAQVVKCLFANANSSYLDLMQQPKYINLLDRIIIAIATSTKFNPSDLNLAAVDFLTQQFNRVHTQLSGRELQ